MPGAIKECKLAPNKREGSFGSSSIGDSKQVYIVITTSVAYDEWTVAFAVDPNTGVYIPSIRDPHPTRPGLYCSNISCSEQAQNCWVVTCDYAAIDPEKLPWDREPVWSGASQKYEKAIDELDTESGEGGEGDFEESTLVRNSAGDPFNPAPTRTASLPGHTCVFNVETFAEVQAIQELEDHLNDSDWFGCPAYTVKLDSVNYSQSSEVIDGDEVNYYAVTLHFIVNNNPWGWRLRLLDSGMRAKQTIDGDDHLVRIRDKAGNEISEPALLDGEGGVLEEGDDPVWFTWIGAPVGDFGDLDLTPPP